MIDTDNKIENLRSLFKHLFEFCDNEWVSVKDHPLTPIYNMFGLDKSWSEAIMFVLSNCNEFAISNDGGNIRYRSKTSVTPNYTKLIGDVVKYFEPVAIDTKLVKYEVRKYYNKTDTVNNKLNSSPPMIFLNENDKQQVFRVKRKYVHKVKPLDLDSIHISSNTQPKVFLDLNEKFIQPIKEKRKYVHKVNTSEFKDNIPPMHGNDTASPNGESNTNIPYKTHFNVDDICYTVYDNKIIEMEIVGVNKKGKDYLHNLYNDEYKIDVFDMLVTDLHDSPESLCAKLLQNYKNK